jgi:hypothetical protein
MLPAALSYCSRLAFMVMAGTVTATDGRVLWLSGLSTVEIPASMTKGGGELLVVVATSNR